MVVVDTMTAEAAEAAEAAKAAKVYTLEYPDDTSDTWDD
jgi:hypothetical protein